MRYTALNEKWIYILGKIDFLEFSRIFLNSCADNILRHRERKGVDKKISSFQIVSGEEICHENPPHSVTPPLFSITTTQWQNGC